jgi:hypothetical protein
MKRNRGAEITLDKDEFPIPYDELAGSSPHTSESEDWSDVDVEEARHTKNGRWALWKSDEALAESLSQSVRERVNQGQALQSSAPGPGNQSQTTTEISSDLYAKAETHNEQLTDDERKLLCSRPGLPSRALADPESLTISERYSLLQWSDPGRLHTAVRDSTNEAARTPEELYSLAHRDGGLAHLSPAAKHLLARNFWLDDGSYRTSAHMKWAKWPGSREAMNLLLSRAGIDLAFLDSVVPFTLSSPILADFPGHISRNVLTAKDDQPMRHDRNSRDKFGDLTWPGGYPEDLTTPPALFFHEKMKAEMPDKIYADIKAEVQRRWLSMSEAEQQVYKAHWRKLRDEAWDLLEARPSKPVPGEPSRGLPNVIDLPGFADWKARKRQEEEERVAAARVARGRNSVGSDGLARFPTNATAANFRPHALYMEDLREQHSGHSLKELWNVDDEQKEATRRFNALSDQERVVYEAWSEQLRKQLWDEREDFERRLDSGNPVRLPRRRDIRSLPLLKSSKKPDQASGFVIARSGCD